MECDLCRESGWCPECDGYGDVPVDIDCGTEECPMCKGNGKCPECRGTGKACR